MSKVEEMIWGLVEPIAENNGLELVDVEFVKEGADWYLRLFIDKLGDEGVDLDDCEVVSRALSEQLEHQDPIEQAYHLEVSSPGIERPLKKTADFIRFAGKLVRVRTFIPIDGKKEFVGLLGETTDTAISLTIEGIILVIPRDKVSKTNLVWEF